MDTILTCAICGENKFGNYLFCTDHFLTKEEFTLVKCSNCGLVFVNPRPKIHELKNYYNSPDYISHSGTEKGIINKIYKKIRRITHKRKFELISSVSSGKTILDIGSGSGELLSLFNENGWKTLGVEPGTEARNYSKKKFGIEVIDEHELEKVENHSFDNISMWHVLEHVPDLNARMNEIKRILKPGGNAFIAVPHLDSHDAEYYREFWAAFDVPRHLYHFSPSTITELFRKHGFSVVRILPMKFDSYYVSLLSEKYKNKKQNFIGGFMRGYISNRKAKQNKNSYSSQIYVIQNSA